MQFQLQPYSTSNSDSDLFPSETRLRLDSQRRVQTAQVTVDSIPFPTGGICGVYGYITGTEKEKEGIGGERARFENGQQRQYGADAESAWIARTGTIAAQTRLTRPRTAGAAAWQLHARGLDAHGERTRTECAPSATQNGTWYLVPAALDSGAGAGSLCGGVREGETIWNEGDGEHQAASGSRVERGGGWRATGTIARMWIDGEEAPARVLEGSLCRLGRTSVWAARPVCGAEFDVVSTRSSTRSVRLDPASVGVGA
ncbi:hypothetical protein C8F04DRAFT_1291675 [Mycena alexandri]|uniref:Uncharacterized protein n=1 Tax=Mycena alexandri TaxID=1745969 RepID=A0AAD6X0Y0_9AGAR|nr:hypothetical protein C8F04DRAFT_1291675 [Mycena alexandri]